MVRITNSYDKVSSGALGPVYMKASYSLWVLVGLTRADREVVVTFLPNQLKMVVENYHMRRHPGSRHPAPRSLEIFTWCKRVTRLSDYSGGRRRDFAQAR